MEIVWELDNLEQLGDDKLDVSGRPAVIAGPYGPAIEFDGVGDALFIGTNPLAGLEAFTIELDFRPDEGGLAEQRFLHLGEANGDRVLFETRLTGTGYIGISTPISVRETRTGPC